MTYNWRGHWERGEIAFHLNVVNPLLEKHWHQLNIANKTHVFVPLCGKTMDLLWFMKQGYYVVGVELSEIACEDFFIENNLSFKKEKKGEFTSYYNDQIEIYCGDFFALSSDILPPITAVYDRAALIALPEELRQVYTKHLAQLMIPETQMLLITYESANLVQGPPYPVPFQEVKCLYGSQFQISELDRFQIVEISKHLLAKKYKELYEVVYRLKKRNIELLYGCNQ